MAFFTNFGVRGDVGLLDWFTASVATFAAVILAAHGATYLMLKTEGTVHDRSAKFAKYLWAAVPPLFIAISTESWAVRPDVPGRAIHNPFCWLGLLVIVAGTTALMSGLLSDRETRAFVGSNAVLVGLLATGSAATFPVMLHSTVSSQNSLTAYAVASSQSALRLALIWWPLAFALALTYFVFISRRYAGKVSIKRDTQGYY
jgi:cytochrome d ubiquinol oxidase subunit II